jgi:hypothetical protein
MKKTNNIFVIFLATLLVAALATVAIMFTEYLVGPVAVYFGASAITLVAGIAVLLTPKN